MLGPVAENHGVALWSKRAAERLVGIEFVAVLIEPGDAESFRAADLSRI